MASQILTEGFASAERLALDKEPLPAAAERGFEFAFGYPEITRLRDLDYAEVTLSSADARRNGH